jgi:predicted HTH domain antitoxin
MATTDLTLPTELVLAAKLNEDNISQETAKIVALQLFRDRTVSIGRAAELCATPLAAFMDYAAAHGVPPLNYDLESLEEDRVTLAKLRL